MGCCLSTFSNTDNEQIGKVSLPEPLTQIRMPSLDVNELEKLGESIVHMLRIIVNLGSQFMAVREQYETTQRYWENRSRKNRLGMRNWDDEDEETVRQKYDEIRCVIEHKLPKDDEQPQICRLRIEWLGKSERLYQEISQGSTKQNELSLFEIECKNKIYYSKEVLAISAEIQKELPVFTKYGDDQAVLSRSEISKLMIEQKDRRSLFNYLLLTTESFLNKFNVIIVNSADFINGCDQDLKKLKLILKSIEVTIKSLEEHITFLLSSTENLKLYLLGTSLMALFEDNEKMTHMSIINAFENSKVITKDDNEIFKEISEFLNSLLTEAEIYKSLLVKAMTILRLTDSDKENLISSHQKTYGNVLTSKNQEIKNLSDILNESFDSPPTQCSDTASTLDQQDFQDNDTGYPVENPIFSLDQTLADPSEFGETREIAEHQDLCDILVKEEALNLSIINAVETIVQNTQKSSKTSTRDDTNQWRNFSENISLDNKTNSSFANNSLDSKINKHFCIDNLDIESEKVTSFLKETCRLMLENIPEKIVTVKSIKGFHGLTCLNGEIALDEALFENNSFEAKGQLLITILHELAHKMRLKYHCDGDYHNKTPSFYYGEDLGQEAGYYLIKKIFGIAFECGEFARINDNFGKRIFEKELWLENCLQEALIPLLSA